MIAKVKDMLLAGPGLKSHQLEYVPAFSYSQAEFQQYNKFFWTASRMVKHKIAGIIPSC